MTKFIKIAATVMLGCMIFTVPVFAAENTKDSTANITTSSSIDTSIDTAVDTEINSTTEAISKSDAEHEITDAEQEKKDKEMERLHEEQEKEIAGEKEKKDEEKNEEKWFHFSLKGFLFQVLVAMILIVLPGCYIYTKGSR